MMFDDRMSKSALDDKGSAMPPGLRWAVFAAVGLLVAGGLYLWAVRGQALLLDLAASAANFFCL